MALAIFMMHAYYCPALMTDFTRLILTNLGWALPKILGTKVINRGWMGPRSVQKKTANEIIKVALSSNRGYDPIR